MMKFIPTNKSKPCPICRKTNGNCRLTQNKLILCMTGVNGSIQSYGYKYRKDSADGLWGIYAPDDGQSYVKKTSFQKKNKTYGRLKKAQTWFKAKVVYRSLSDREIDHHIRAIIKHLNLSKGDRFHLKERGLSDEEIDKGLFVTIKPFSKLPESISMKLAGVYKGKNDEPHIGSSYQQGILCPLFNKKDFVIGYQIMRTVRDDDDGNKYIWASTGEKREPKTHKIIRKKISSHLQNGELPLNYHYVKGKRNKILYLNDGIFKTYMAHCLHKIDIVGCSGGLFANAMKQFCAIARNYDQFIYALDAGDVMNPTVMKRLKHLAIILKEKRMNLEFAYWGQISKSGNDIDEMKKLEYELFSFDDLSSQFSII